MISAVVAIAFSRLVDGDQIFARARDVWATQSVPAYLEYTVATTVSRSGHSTTNHYAAACYCEKNQLADGPVTLHGRTYDTVRISFDDLRAATSRSKKFWLQTPVYDPLSEP